MKTTPLLLTEFAGAATADVDAPADQESLRRCSDDGELAREVDTLQDLGDGAIGGEATVQAGVISRAVPVRPAPRAQVAS